jgi:hypothetical protein
VYVDAIVVQSTAGDFGLTRADFWTDLTFWVGMDVCGLGKHTSDDDCARTSVSWTAMQVTQTRTKAEQWR